MEEDEDGIQARHALVQSPHLLDCKRSSILNVRLTYQQQYPCNALQEDVPYHHQHIISFGGFADSQAACLVSSTISNGLSIVRSIGLIVFVCRIPFLSQAESTNRVP